MTMWERIIEDLKEEVQVAKGLEETLQSGVKLNQISTEYLTNGLNTSLNRIFNIYQDLQSADGFEPSDIEDYETVIHFVNLAEKHSNRIREFAF